ncbi:MAG: WD40 repeat domain-containing protein [Chloroflexaceae bacterium]
MKHFLLVLVCLFGLAACLPQIDVPDTSPVTPGRPATHTPVPPVTPVVQPGAPATPAVPLRRLAQSGEGVPLALARDPAGTRLFVASAQRLRAVEVDDLTQVIWEAPLEALPVALVVSSDGATLAVALGATLELRAAATGVVIRRVELGATVMDMDLAPDGATLALALANRTVALLDGTGKAPQRELRETDQSTSLPLLSLAFAPNGRELVTGDSSGDVVVWDVSRGEPMRTMNIGVRDVLDVAYAPDGATIAAASAGWRTEPGSVWLFDAASGDERARLSSTDTFLGPVARVAFAAGGTQILAGAQTGELVRWSWPEGLQRDQLVAHRAAISAFVPTPDGGVITGGYDGALRRWNARLEPVNEVRSLPAISAVAASPATLVAGGEDGRLIFFDAGGALLRELPAHDGAIHALAIAPGGDLLASAGSDTLIRLWSLPDGTPRGELVGHEGPVLALAFNPEGDLLASADYDGIARLWRVPEGVEQRSITVLETDGLSATAVTALAFDAQGQTLLAGALSGSIQRFAVSDGAALESLQTGASDRIIGLTTTPRDTILALDSSGTLWQWNAAGQLRGAGATAAATGLAPVNDRYALTVGAEGGLRLWRIGDDGPGDVARAESLGRRVSIWPNGSRAVSGSEAGYLEVWEISLM